MTMDKKRVFVLGAGFTKAFLPDAPLLTDFYDQPVLTKKYEQFSYASRVLNQEIKRNACRRQGGLTISVATTSSSTVRSGTTSTGPSSLKDNQQAYKPGNPSQ